MPVDESSDKNVYPPTPKVSLCDCKLGTRGIANSCQQTLAPPAFVATASCLRALSTSTSKLAIHKAHRHNRHGPAARTARSQSDGSRCRQHRRTCSGIRIWSGTKTLATPRKHRNRPARTPSCKTLGAAAVLQYPDAPDASMYADF